MAYVDIGGLGTSLPERPGYLDPVLTPGAATLDATGEMVGLCGCFWHPERTTKNVRKIGILLGTVLKAGGSGLTFSLQNLSTSAGGPMQPDGTPDQSVNIANGDSNFATNTWLLSGALSADRSLTFGEPVAAVIEFDGSGRLGSDVVNVRGMISTVSSFPHRGLSFSHKTGGSWSGQTLIPSIIFECDDGSYGTLMGAFAFSTATNHTYNSSSNPNEHGNRFIPPCNLKIDGLWADVGIGVADWDLVLYEDTTVLATASFDDRWSNTSSGRQSIRTIAEQELIEGNSYYISVKPTTTTSLNAYSFDVDNANHLKTHSGGTNFNYTTRNGSSWAAPTTTRRLMAGVRVSQIQSGGGVLLGKGIQSGGLM